MRQKAISNYVPKATNKHKNAFSVLQKKINCQWFDVFIILTISSQISPTLFNKGKRLRILFTLKLLTSEVVELIAFRFSPCKAYHGASLVAQMVKNLPATQETWVQFLGPGDPLEKGMAPHSSILAWRIPWTEEPGGLQSMRSQRVRHDWATNTFTFSRCIIFHAVNGHCF